MGPNIEPISIVMKVIAAAFVVCGVLCFYVGVVDGDWYYVAVGCIILYAFCTSWREERKRNSKKPEEEERERQ
jgi:hypothetical protein